MEKTIEEQVIDIVCDEMGCESANLDDRLQEDLSMDSLDIAETMAKLEDLYGIHLDSLSRYDVKTVNDLVNLVLEAL